MNFLDKKHIVNHNCIPKKVRNDPLTGERPAIFVSGNFCDTFNIFVCISVNPVKKTPIAYHIERNNWTAVCFVAFISNMIKKGWLLHNEILIMDNATVHTGKQSSIVKDFLWYTVIDGRPLKILVIYLPPPCPELKNKNKSCFEQTSASILSWQKCQSISCFKNCYQCHEQF